MEDEERQAEEIRQLFRGHPPRKPAEILASIREILNPPKRKAKAGRTREEKGGLDREG